VRNLDVAYGQRLALRHLTLHVDQGEIVSLIGANGAGKTTLLRTVAGLQRAAGGSVAFRGQDVTRLPADRVAFLEKALRQAAQTPKFREALVARGEATLRHRDGAPRRLSTAPVTV